MIDIDVYEDIGTSKSNSETNRGIRKLLAEGENQMIKRNKAQGIKRKTIEIDKSTFLTTAARILGNASQLGVEAPYEKVMEVLKKVEEEGYPLEKFRNMDKQECLSYFKDLKSKIISKIPEY